MSAMGFELWLDKALAPEQIRQVNTLFQKCAGQQKLGMQAKSWRDQIRGKNGLSNLYKRYAQRLQYEMSPELKAEFVRLTPLITNLSATAAYRWYFKMDEQAEFMHTPALENYTFGHYLPRYRFNLSQNFLNEALYGFFSPSDLETAMSRLEATVAELGQLPSAYMEGMLDVPRDYRLLGYIIIELLDMLGGWWVVWRRSRDTWDVLAGLSEAITAGLLPGNIKSIRYLETCKTGKQIEHIQYIVDAEFLRAWIKLPSFRYF